MVPHNSRKYQVILDLSFILKIFGMEIPSVNNNTVITAPQHSMRQLGQVLPRLIESVAHAPTANDHIMFSTLDIHNGYWKILVEMCKKKMLHMYSQI